MVGQPSRPRTAPRSGSSGSRQPQPKQQCYDQRPNSASATSASKMQSEEDWMVSEGPGPGGFRGYSSIGRVSVSTKKSQPEIGRLLSTAPSSCFANRLLYRIWDRSKIDNG
jgi:hypothetical protein